MGGGSRIAVDAFGVDLRFGGGGVRGWDIKTLGLNFFLATLQKILRIYDVLI